MTNRVFWSQQLLLLLPCKNAHCVIENVEGHDLRLVTGISYIHLKGTPEGLNLNVVVGEVIGDVDPDAHLSVVSSRITNLACLGKDDFLIFIVVNHVSRQICREKYLCWVLAVRYLLVGVG